MHKKSLLGTTALLVVMFSFAKGAYAAEASPPKKEEKRKSNIELQISGKTSFNAIMGSQSQKTLTYYEAASLAAPTRDAVTKNQSGMFTVDGAKLGFAAIGRTNTAFSTPLEFGLHIVITGNTGADLSVKESFIEAKLKEGTILAGDTSGVDDRMNFGGRDTQVGTGGIDGNFTRFVSIPYGAITSLELAGNPYGDTGDATKITYLTPRWEGFQLGVSFTPDSKHDGEDKLNTGFVDQGFMPNPFERNSLAMGINYVKPFGDIKVSLSLTGRSGELRPERFTAAPGQSLLRQKTQVWALGGLFEYQDFQLGLQYIGCGKSGQFVADRQGVDPGRPGMVPLDYNASQARAANIFNIGLGYTVGSWKYSWGLYLSERAPGFEDRTAKAKTLTVGAEYVIVEGLNVYAEAARYDCKNPAAPYEMRLRAQSLPANSGAIIAGNVGTSQRATSCILGTKIKF